MKNKSKKVKQAKWKYWLIEDGSVDIGKLKEFIAYNDLKITVIVYRQGSQKPKLKEF